MTDYTYLRKQITAAAVDARKAIDIAERAVLLVDPKQLLCEQPYTVFTADKTLCVASDKFEAFYFAADDLVTIAEENDD